jgi:hypothetical protein
MSSETANAGQAPRIYRPCVTGLKCAAWYRSDYLRRVERGLENQGTGNIIEDLTAKLEALHSPSKVEGRDCTEGCPIPGERANVECPDGKLHKVFWEDLDSLLARWE